MDGRNASTTNGTHLEISTCHGSANQQFSYQSDGTIRGSQSGKCVTVQNAATANGSKLILWTCNTGGTSTGPAGKGYAAK